MSQSIRKRLDSLKSLRLVNKKKKDGEDEVIEEHIIEKSSSNSEDEDKVIRDLNATSSPAKKRESTKCEIKYEIVNGEVGLREIIGRFNNIWNGNIDNILFCNGIPFIF